MRPLESIYHATHHRIVDLLADTETERPAKCVAVPACPSWSVHGVISHTSGICGDVLSGNIAGAAEPEWTTAQVAVRRDLSTAEVLDEWDQNGPKLAAILDDFPGQYGRQLVADLAVHEQDLRGALGRRGARDSDAVVLGVEFLVMTLLDAGAIALGLGPLEIRTGERRWRVGTGEPAGGDPRAAFAAAASSDPADKEPVRGRPVCRLDLETFELFRAATGRRSPGQVRRYQWSGDCSAYLALFDLWPFTLREDDLVE